MTQRMDFSGRKTAQGYNSRDLNGMNYRNTMSHSQLKYGLGDLGHNQTHSLSHF